MHVCMVLPQLFSCTWFSCLRETRAYSLTNLFGVLWHPRIKFDSVVVFCGAVWAVMLSEHISTLLRPPSLKAAASIPSPPVHVHSRQLAFLGSNYIPDFLITEKLNIIGSTILQAGKTDPIVVQTGLNEVTKTSWAMSSINPPSLMSLISCAFFIWWYALTACKLMLYIRFQ